MLCLSGDATSSDNTYDLQLALSGVTIRRTELGLVVTVREDAVLDRDEAGGTTDDRIGQYNV